MTFKGNYLNMREKNYKMRGRAAANEHIAKIAALPRGINILLFSQTGSR
jgi:hypothetical protein